MDYTVFDTHAEKVSDLLKVMANTHRLTLLSVLCQGERCVGELENIIGISQSALSQHLARLRERNLVSTRRKAQTIYYSLSSQDVKKLLFSLYEIYKKEDGQALPLSFHLRERPSLTLHHDISPDPLIWP